MTGYGITRCTKCGVWTINESKVCSWCESQKESK